MKHHTISFINAGKGIWTAIITQANIRIHFIVGSLVLFSAVYLHISPDQVIDLILTISLVIIAEMVNTSLEFMSDAVTLEHDENIKFAKDVAAGAVLVSAIFATIVGFMIFIPKLI
ncbi:MAG: diacylglycerol kinase family protein [bacterium]